MHTTNVSLSSSVCCMCAMTLSASASLASGSLTYAATANAINAPTATSYPRQRLRCVFARSEPHLEDKDEPAPDAPGGPSQPRARPPFTREPSLHRPSGRLGSHVHLRGLGVRAELSFEGQGTCVDANDAARVSWPPW